MARCGACRRVVRSGGVLVAGGDAERRGRARRAPAADVLDAGLRVRAVARSALADLDVHHHRRRLLDRLLFDRLHGRRPRIRALLRVHEVLRVRDADARARGQLRRTARRLGPRRPRVLLLDRILVRAAVGGCGGAQGLRDQRRRRRRHDVRDLFDRGERTLDRLRRRLRGERHVRHRACSSRSASRSSSARRRSRPRFRCTRGCPTRWKGRRRSRR